MTSEEIRQAIEASPALMALVPDADAIAAALSEGRTSTVETLGGVGYVMAVLGPTSGAAVLDALDALAATNSVVKWAWVLINRGELDFGHPTTRAMITSLVPAVMTTAQADALLAAATVPALVDEFDVRRAIWADDGTLLVGGA
jgi:hypothetical protein